MSVSTAHRPVALPSASNVGTIADSRSRRSPPTSTHVVELHRVPGGQHRLAMPVELLQRAGLHQLARAAVGEHALPVEVGHDDRRAGDVEHRLQAPAALLQHPERRVAVGHVAQRHDDAVHAGAVEHVGRGRLGVDPRAVAVRAGAIATTCSRRPRRGTLTSVPVKSATSTGMQEIGEALRRPGRAGRAPARAAGWRARSCRRRRARPRRPSRRRGSSPSARGRPASRRSGGPYAEHRGP